ncbi:MAG: glutaredoxin [Spirochaetales bacterium]|nr:MAG: glutaredoxin [Spirochaetales bacterium]
MFDRFFLTQVDGTIKDHNLTLLALSTCGFCKSAMRFLNEKGIAYSYTFVDKMEPKLKEELKEEFRNKFNERLLYPILIKDDKEVLTGFIEVDWKLTLGLT